MSFLGTGPEGLMPRKNIADHVSLSYISIVKEQTTQDRPGRSLLAHDRQRLTGRTGLDPGF
jgi:hypothetical protein